MVYCRSVSSLLPPPSFLGGGGVSGQKFFYILPRRRLSPFRAALIALTSHLILS